MFEDLLPVWIAFGRLMDGSGDISYTDIISYLDEEDISTEEDRETVIRLIRSLQAAKQIWESDKLKSKSKRK